MPVGGREHFLLMQRHRVIHGTGDAGGGERLLNRVAVVGKNRVLVIHMPTLAIGIGCFNDIAQQPVVTFGDGDAARVEVVEAL